MRLNNDQFYILIILSCMYIKSLIACVDIAVFGLFFTFQKYFSRIQLDAAFPRIESRWTAPWTAQAA